MLWEVTEKKFEVVKLCNNDKSYIEMQKVQGHGFTKWDLNNYPLRDIYNAIKNREPNQLEAAILRDIMPKYWKQMYELSDKDKILAQMKRYNETDFFDDL